MKKTLDTRLTELIFGLKKKNSYTYLKINNFLYLPEKTSFLYLCKKVRVLDFRCILNIRKHQPLFICEAV